MRNIRFITIAAVSIMLSACGNLSSSESSTYRHGSTELIAFESATSPPGGEWSNVAVMDHSVSPADFGGSRDVDYLVGMSEGIAIGTVSTVAGPFRIIRDDDEKQTSGTVDGIFWVDVKVDEALVGNVPAEGESLTHAVIVLLDLDTGGVFQFEEDLIPSTGARRIFFVQEFKQFGDLPYVRITGAGSGRIAESDLQRSLGVLNTEALVQQAEGRLGLVAAANRTQQAEVTGTTLPAID